MTPRPREDTAPRDGPSTLDLGQETEPGEGSVVGVGVLLSATQPRKHADTDSGG